MSASSSSSSSLPAPSPDVDVDVKSDWLTHAYERHAKRTKWMMEPPAPRTVAADTEMFRDSHLSKVLTLVQSHYSVVRHMPAPVAAKPKPATASSNTSTTGTSRAPSTATAPLSRAPRSSFSSSSPVHVQDVTDSDDLAERERTQIIDDAVNSMPAATSSSSSSSPASSSSSTALTLFASSSSSSSSARPHSSLLQSAPPPVAGGGGGGDAASTAVVPIDLNARSQLIAAQREQFYVKPVWHAPWKLMRVIAGHQGWVRSVSVDPTNEWFVTGSTDRTIKIWDLASGDLKLTLTGHVSVVRGVLVSPRHPYMFSCSEDKTVRCWDLEYNRSIRNYHGHLSGVYALNLHPTLDVLFSGGRDSTCRVWDMRTKVAIAVYSGHTSTVSSICSQNSAPQVVTGSHDSTIRLWDLVAGKCLTTLTHHKKSVRAMLVHPHEYTFASAAADNIKVWKCPEGAFLRNVSGHNAILNAVTVNRDNVMVSGGDEGSLHFWDWSSGYSFQQLTSPPQPGSLDSENGIFSLAFDVTGSRLLTAEADKTVKVYREDPTATPASHPIQFKPPKHRRY